MNIGPLEVILILVVVVLLFGAKKLPELARSLGRSMGEFKKGKEEGAKMLEEEKDTKKITDSSSQAQEKKS